MQWLNGKGLSTIAARVIEALTTSGAQFLLEVSGGDMEHRHRLAEMVREGWDVPEVGEGVISVLGNKEIEVRVASSGGVWERQWRGRMVKGDAWVILSPCGDIRRAKHLMESSPFALGLFYVRVKSPLELAYVKTELEHIALLKCLTVSIADICPYKEDGRGGMEPADGELRGWHEIRIDTDEERLERLGFTYDGRQLKRKRDMEQKGGDNG